MVWKTIKEKCHLQGKIEKNNDKPKSCGNDCCKCGDQCKRCGTECKCSTKKIYIRSPMFTYYTDTMH
ncbi:hypothetical protein TSAR_004581 [Trichomalopsis sarcophagae]|uniref:Metallothionein n=1 Tax=Trichomalopsis sarcophagae TaxID=543379 RepID=A0A232F820_9HYME|nr:hypothetical protein TSAR_004581 [Trichomalopsis sarcophagae]